jgi:Amt family ammonium transporter
MLPVQAYLIYSAVLTSVVYPPVVHMMWNNGKFSAHRSLGKNGGEGALFMNCGLTDFAGSAVVHLTGGVAALVGAAMIGPRAGRWAPGYQLPKGDPVLQSLGVFILWTGWYGFNAASTLAINGHSAIAAHVCVTTTISASTGCLCCSLIGYVQNHVIDPAKVNNGVLAGLVAITAGCSVVTYAGAFCTGLIAGPLFLLVSAGMKRLGIDDVVDAVAVHGACGCWGVIAAALFSSPFYYNMTYGERGTHCAGVFYGGSGAALVVALVCIGVIVSWVGSTMAIVFGALKMAGYLRVSAHVEEIGMDDSKHGGGIHHPDPDLDPPPLVIASASDMTMGGEGNSKSFKSVAPTSLAADDKA